MDDSMEANGIELYSRSQTRDEMTITLHTSKTWVLQSIQQSHETGLVSNAMRPGPPRRIPKAIASYINVRMIQDPSISGEISEQFGISLSRTVLDVVGTVLQVAAHLAWPGIDSRSCRGSIRFLSQDLVSA
jgi:hypothetical protein